PAASGSRRSEPSAPSGSSRSNPSAVASGFSRTEGSVKDALLAEIRRSKMVFYSTDCAQAQQIEDARAHVSFTFSSTLRTRLKMFEENRARLESIEQQVAGRRIAMSGAIVDSSAAPDTQAGGGQPAVDRTAEKKSALREQALADAGVQAMLEVFPAEIRDVEE